MLITGDFLPVLPGVGWATAGIHWRRAIRRQRTRGPQRLQGNAFAVAFQQPCDLTVQPAQGYLLFRRQGATGIGP